MPSGEHCRRTWETLLRARNEEGLRARLDADAALLRCVVNTLDAIYAQPAILVALLIQQYDSLRPSAAQLQFEWHIAS